MENTTNSQQKFDDVAKLLSTKKNIIVLAGAGISVSCGIPDFRSEKGREFYLVYIMWLLYIVFISYALFFYHLQFTIH